MQIITISEENYKYYANRKDFIQKYIFPGGMLPTKSLLKNLAKNNNLTFKEHVSFGKDYAKTLSMWRNNFLLNWNKVKKLKTRLFDKINEGDYMYLVHSYFVPTINETIGQSEYGLTYSVAVQKENFFGVQFHPEKSSSSGSQLLKNFLEL